MRTLAYGALVLAGLALVIGAVMYQDSQREVSVAVYEACVESEYGRSPSAFMVEHGYYPDCY